MVRIGMREELVSVRRTSLENTNNAESHTNTLKVSVSAPPTRSNSPIIKTVQQSSLDVQPADSVGSTGIDKNNTKVKEERVLTPLTNVESNRSLGSVPPIEKPDPKDSLDTPTCSTDLNELPQWPLVKYKYTQPGQKQDAHETTEVAVQAIEPLTGSQTEEKIELWLNATKALADSTMQLASALVAQQQAKEHALQLEALNRENQLLKEKLEKYVNVERKPPISPDSTSKPVVHETVSDLAQPEISASEEGSQMKGTAREMAIGDENVESSKKLFNQKISTRDSCITFWKTEIPEETGGQSEESVRVRTGAKESKDELKDDEIVKLEAEEELLVQEIEMMEEHERQLDVQKSRDQLGNLESEDGDERKRIEERKILTKKSLVPGATIVKSNMQSTRTYCKDKESGDAASVFSSSWAEEMNKMYQRIVYDQRIRSRLEKLESEDGDERKKIEERIILTKKLLALRATSVKSNMQWRRMWCMDKESADAAFVSHSSRVDGLQEDSLKMVTFSKIPNQTKAIFKLIDDATKDYKDIEVDFNFEIVKINAAYDAKKAQAPKEKVSVTPKVEEAEKDQSSNAVTEEESKPNGCREVMAENLEENNKVKEVPDDQSQPNPTKSLDAKSELTGDGIQFLDEDSLRIYFKSQRVLVKHKKLCSSLTDPDMIKKFRSKCRKITSIPATPIIGVTSKHLIDNFEKLNSLLGGKPPTNASQHPRGIDFCKYTLAKTVVIQGGKLVSSKPEMAFSIAAVAVALWNEYPDFGELLLAYFHKTCPYLVPIYLPRDSPGYKYPDEGTYEEQQKFVKKISSYMRLYAALIVTNQRKHLTTPHPHGLKNAWRWLAAVSNIESRHDDHDVSAALILTMLKVAGHDLWKTYKNEFRKLLTLLAEKYQPRTVIIEDKKTDPVIKQLQQFLTTSLTSDSISPPLGRLDPNIW